MRLGDIAHARAGDKGNTSDITVIAYQPGDYPLLREQLTPALVRDQLADIVRGPVDRYEIPQLHALKFVLHDALGGGVTRTLSLDAHGKTLSSSLLEMELPMPPEGGNRRIEMTDTVVVAAPAGRFRGTTAPDGGALFAGIPFAEPPVGALRFRPPRAVPDWASEVDATRFRAAPAQNGNAHFPVADPAEPGTGTSAPASPGGQYDSPLKVMMATRMPETSEDCLYLNVWSPGLQGRLPVVVWFYGGGFEMGSAAPPQTDGTALSRQTGTVFVAVNYRVGALGFGYWAGIGGEQWAESGNLGLQDLACGLAWVRRNIAAFGGDPANVTVAGESAGAFCIGSLLTAPMSAGLFDKAIMHSGSTRRVFPPATATAMARDLADRVGASSMEDLQAVDVQSILAAQSQVIDSDIGTRNLPGGRSWGVVLDGVTLPRDPHEALRGGAARHIPLLVGANHDEVAMFRVLRGDAFTPPDAAALLDELARAGAPDPGQALAGYRERVQAQGGSPDDLAAIRSAFLTDAIYRRPAIEMALAQAAAGGRSFAFLFSATPFGPALGAFHAADQFYVFGNYLEAVGAAAPGDFLPVRDALTGSWAAFARDGDPGWSPYDPEQPGNARQFGGAPFTTEPPRDRVLSAWPLS
jgi:para-nitrobenzyl esterase